MNICHLTTINPQDTYKIITEDRKGIKRKIKHTYHCVRLSGQMKERSRGNWCNLIKLTIH